jgi:calcium-dependent protein kinase
MDRFDLISQFDDKSMQTDVGVYEIKSRIGYQVVIKKTPLLARSSHNLRNHQAVIALLRMLPAHEHVIRPYDDFVEDGEWCIVMEHCTSGDLQELIMKRPDNRLDEAAALGIFRQIALGLAFLHHNGIAHRDLALENVFCDRGVMKIGDFGLCTDAESRSRERVGRSYYMAPEVSRGDAYDPRAADIWSLGCLLFILVTGSPLVTPSSAKDGVVYKAIQHLGLHKIVASWGVAASKETLDFIGQMLQVDPARRPTIATVLETVPN